MDVDLTDSKAQPKIDIDVDVEDLNPRLADGTRSNLNAAPRARATLPPPIPRAARGTSAPRPSKPVLVQPRATPEMMASWQLNPEAPLTSVPDAERVAGEQLSEQVSADAAKVGDAIAKAKLPPPIPAAAKSKVMPAVEPALKPLGSIELKRAPELVTKPEAPLPSLASIELKRAPELVTKPEPAPLPFNPPPTIELVKAPEAPKKPELPKAEPLVLTGNAPHIAPPVVAPAGADVADLPQWPTLSAPVVPDVVTSAPRIRPTQANPNPSAPSALDGSDAWVFEDDYEERQVDGEVVPTTYFEKFEDDQVAPRSNKKLFIAIGGAAAALAVIVAIATHGSSEKKPVAATTKAAPAQVAQTEAPAPAQAAPAPVQAAPVQAAPAPADTNTAPASADTAPAAETAPATPSKTATSLTNLAITSTPAGATVTLVDNGNAVVLGRTPVSAALDPSHSYDVVLAGVNRPTVVKHVDLATMKNLAVELPAEGTAVAETKSAPAPVAAPEKKIASAPVAAAPEHRHHHHSSPQTSAPTGQLATPSFDTAPKQVAVADGNGVLMVSAKPPCEIYVDGKATHLTTPQRSISVSAGQHSITLVNMQMGVKKTIAVKVDAHKPTKLIQDFTKG
ncbi:MAG: hypothetical protein QM831_38035 [Kofleriaceae bacterium]